MDFFSADDRYMASSPKDNPEPNKIIDHSLLRKRCEKVEKLRRKKNDDKK